MIETTKKKYLCDICGKIFGEKEEDKAGGFRFQVSQLDWGWKGVKLLICRKCWHERFDWEPVTKAWSWGS